MFLKAESRLLTPNVVQSGMPADDPAIGSISSKDRPIPAPLPLASQYSLYNLRQPDGWGVKTLNESAPPARLMLQGKQQRRREEEIRLVLQPGEQNSAQCTY